MSSDATLRRWATAAVVLVAAIAATVSYLHVYRLSLALGQPQLAALLMPLSVDGSVGAASAALLAAARLGNKTPRMAQGMLTLGVLATLAANAYSGLGHGIAGMVVGGWPAVAFIGSTEVALGMARRSAGAATEAASQPVGAEVPTVGRHSVVELDIHLITHSVSIRRPDLLTPWTWWRRGRQIA